MQRHGRIEQMPPDIREVLGAPALLDELRRIYLAPEVTREFDVRPFEPDLDGLVQFLCDDREFGRERVVAAVERTFRERSLGLDR